MKYLVRTLALATAISGVMSVQAIGADDDIDILTASEGTFVEIGSGWYLRGDITASINGNRVTEAYSGGTTQYTSEFRDMVGYEIGAGYRFTNNFRADMTLGHYLSGSSESTGQSLSPATDCPGLSFDAGSGTWIAGPITNCSTYNQAEYDTFALMGTGYFDLNPIGAFEPYVGAGLGIARVRWNEVTGGIICAPVSAEIRPEVCTGFGGDTPGVNEIYRHGGVNASGVDYRLAYSVTAGFGYRIKDNMLIDVSYRFMGVSDTMGIATGTTKAQSTAKDGFGLHQIKFGLRYEIW